MGKECECTELLFDSDTDPPEWNKTKET